MATAELSGVSIVGAGSFNPAILHPKWLLEKGIISEHIADHALSVDGEKSRLIVSSQLTSFVGDWLSVQVTPQQLVVATVDQAREMDLRDVARSIFDLLPETPVTAIGINTDVHFRMHTETAWHEFGDRFLPKDFWEPLFSQDEWVSRSDGKRVGMRSMTVEVARRDDAPGWIRMELAPSMRLTPYGVFIGINSHYQLDVSEKRSSAADASRVLGSQWEFARATERELVGKLMSAI